jgi:hypothetical protein
VFILIYATFPVFPKSDLPDSSDVFPSAQNAGFCDPVCHQYKNRLELLRKIFILYTTILVQYTNAKTLKKNRIRFNGG